MSQLHLSVITITVRMSNYVYNKFITIPLQTNKQKKKKVPLSQSHMCTICTLRLYRNLGYSTYCDRPNHFN